MTLEFLSPQPHVAEANESHSLHIVFLPVVLVFVFARIPHSELSDEGDCNSVHPYAVNGLPQSLLLASATRKSYAKYDAK